MIRRPGRPPLDDADPSTQMSLRLPSKHYDAVYRAAARDRVTVPELHPSNVVRTIAVARNRTSRHAGANLGAVLDRAYALLSIKALDGDRRIISGLASTPTPDRRGDVLEPLGATFRNPLPLLLHHDRERPGRPRHADRDGARHRVRSRAP